MTNLVVPSFIWQAPPEHYVVSILGVRSSDGKLEKVVTGSTSGVLCIWNIEGVEQVIHFDGCFLSLQTIKPSFLLTNPEASCVIGLAATTYEWKQAVITGLVRTFSFTHTQCTETALRP